MYKFSLKFSLFFKQEKNKKRYNQNMSIFMDTENPNNKKKHSEFLHTRQI